MTVADVAFGSAWPAKGAPPRWMVAAFALAFAGWGLVSFAIRFAGADTYAAIARESGFAETTSFLLPAGEPDARPQRVDLAALVRWHEDWTEYVLGRTPTVPRTFGLPTFTADEVRHMANVRTVFTGAQAAMYASAAALLALGGIALRRGGARSFGVLMRNGGAAAGVSVTIVAVIAAAAFEPAFLAFHYVFFPQGNFLFDPATSNLIRLYPEPYWYGVTIRVGGAFIASAAALTLAGWLVSRSAIVRAR